MSCILSLCGHIHSHATFYRISQNYNIADFSCTDVRWCLHSIHSFWCHILLHYIYSRVCPKSLACENNTVNLYCTYDFHSREIYRTIRTLRICSTCLYLMCTASIHNSRIFLKLILLNWWIRFMFRNYFKQIVSYIGIVFYCASFSIKSLDNARRFFNPFVKYLRFNNN